MMKPEEVEERLKDATCITPSRELDRRIEALLTAHVRKSSAAREAVTALLLEAAVSIALVVYAIVLGLKP
jgi:hypothetical protein